MNIIELNTGNIYANAYIGFIVFFVGSCIGSFLNVAALRLLTDESVIFPGSRCPVCSKKIKWYDNIPILSFLILKGKCRNCKSSISIQYPLVEFITGLLFLAIFIVFGLGLKSLFLFTLISFLTVITITDLKEKLIYDITSMPLIPLGLVYNFFNIGEISSNVVEFSFIGLNFSLNEAFISALAGALIGAAFFEILSRVGLIFVGQYAFGGGDTVLGAALGAWFGWKMIIIILILSFIFQVIIGIPVILANMIKDKDYKSVIFMNVLLFSLFVPYIGQFLGLTTNLLGALFTTILSFGLAATGIVVILSRLKERKSFTFLPFGPALVFGGLVVIFFGNELLTKFFM